MAEESTNLAAALRESPSAPLKLDPDFLERFVENQARETTLREQELALQRFDKENAHNYALKVLEAQVQDRREQRADSKHTARAGGWVSALILLGFFVLIGLAMWLNKDALLMELARILGYGLGGGGFGYALGRRKEQQQEQQSA